MNTNTIQRCRHTREIVTCMATVGIVEYYVYTELFQMLQLATYHILTYLKYE